MFEVIFYKDEKGHSPVHEYLSSLSKQQQDKVIAYMDRLARFGFGLRRPVADNLGGGLGLYELRPDRNRILYCFHRRTQVLLLHAFLKRTDDIPPSEIEIALKRRADYLKREVPL